MSLRTFCAISMAFVGVAAAGLAAANVLTEYGSLADWNAAVSDVSTYKITQLSPGLGGNTPPEVFGFNPVTIGPGVFTGDTQSAVIYNDGLYGAGIQYFSDDPRALGQHNAIPGVTVAFSAADDISALAFEVGAGAGPSDIGISVNGFAVAPVVVSSLFPTMFVGVTDTAGPITSIKFTASGPGEMDLINGYETASARPTAAPEISLTTAPAAITFLVGLLAVLLSRRTSSVS